MEYPWQKATVHGTPLQLNVLPDPNSRDYDDSDKNYGVCKSTDAAMKGRFLSTDAEVSSRRFADMFHQPSRREFSWAPYKCKIPPRTTEEALIALPSAEHILWIGDSTLRGPFHQKLLNGLSGNLDWPSITRKSHDHAFTWGIIQHPKTGYQRNVSFSRIFAHDDIKEVLSAIESLSTSDDTPKPTHVVFNMGL